MGVWHYKMGRRKKMAEDTGEKNWVVIALDCYNDIDARVFEEAIGPFTELQATEYVKDLSQKQMYATEFRAVKLSTKHWSDT